MDTKVTLKYPKVLKDPNSMWQFILQQHGIFISLPATAHYPLLPSSYCALGKELNY